MCGVPGIPRTTDFRNIPGGSAIRRNTVIITSCDRRVNRIAGEEGVGSDPARRPTEQKRCQLERIVLAPTGRNYPFSHVVPCYRRETVTTGRDPRLGERSDERRR